MMSAALLFIKERRFLFLLLALVNLILTPLYFFFIEGESPRVIVAISSLFVVLAGGAVCMKMKRTYITIGVLVVLMNGIEFFNSENLDIKCLRTVFSVALYSLMIRVILGYLISLKKVSLDDIFGAISGYLILGLLGGSVYEFIYYLIPNSFSFNVSSFSDYIFYYYSFVGLSTVGFGDVVPTNPQSQSITILINMAGQFYMAIILTLFVSKYFNSLNNK